MQAAVDSNNRPLVVPVANVPQNTMGVGPTAGYGLNGLQVAGLPVVVDANISTTGGASNTEDSIFVVRREDMLLFESAGAPSMVRMDQTLGGQLTPIVRLAPTGGVEGGAVQLDAVVVDRHDRGLEGPQVGVTQVDAIGHALTPRSRQGR